MKDILHKEDKKQENIYATSVLKAKKSLIGQVRLIFIIYKAIQLGFK
jgi:hypothetical protein